MLADSPRVLGRLTLDVVVEQVVKPSNHHYFLVGQGSQLDGVLSRAQIEAVPRKRWTTTRVEDVMFPASRLKTVGPDAALTTILEQMTAPSERLFIVVDGERPIGLITPDTLLRFLHARAGQPLQLLDAQS